MSVVREEGWLLCSAAAPVSLSSTDHALTLSRKQTSEEDNDSALLSTNQDVDKQRDDEGCGGQLFRVSLPLVDVGCWKKSWRRVS